MADFNIGSYLNARGNTYTNNTTGGTDKTDKKEEVNNSGVPKNWSGASTQLEMEDFLQLIIKQMQNQDVMNPTDNAEFLNQLVQMSTIQAMTTMTDATVTSYAASLVGKEVTVAKIVNGKVEEVVGVVTGSGTAGGQHVIFVNGEMYNVTQIMAVGKLPPPKEEKPEEKPPAPDNELPKPPDVPDNGLPEKPPIDGDGETPETPETPPIEGGGTPETPETPETPPSGDSGTPETPPVDGGGTPEIPETPETPETPSEGGTPETSETPETPGGGEGGGETEGGIA